MRKQIVAAGALPFQRRTERRGIDRDQDEVRLPGKVLGGGFGELRRAGEMDEAVARVGRRAEEFSAALGRAPLRLRADFVDRRHPDLPSQTCPQCAATLSTLEPSGNNSYH